MKLVTAIVNDVRQSIGIVDIREIQRRKQRLTTITPKTLYVTWFAMNGIECAVKLVMAIAAAANMLLGHTMQRTSERST